MKIEIIGQPFPGRGQVGATLRAALDDPAARGFWGVTAWAKHSGLSRMAAAIKGFRERGGTAEIIVGIDEGGATREGLRLAADLFDCAYVFHDEGTRTFHPKIYAVEGERSATLLIGSGNATKGGLFTNYEAASHFELDLASAEDLGVLGAARSYYDSLVALEDSCRLLDDETLEQLFADDRYRIGAERRANRRSAASRTTTGGGIFGSPVPGLQNAPAPDVEPLGDEEADVDESGAPPAPPEEEVVEAGAAEGSAEESGTTGFWKALSAWDVNPDSAPGQIIIPIRFLDFFGPLALEKEAVNGGSEQHGTHIEVEFRDGAYATAVDDARAVLYIPAEDHPRPNRELRFTFRNREVFERLSQDEILEFRRVEGRIVVERHVGPREGRFGDL